MGVEERNGGLSVQGLNAPDHSCSTALKVIASSKPAAHKVWRTRASTRSIRVRWLGAIGTLTSSGIRS
jgi:hypothetical protein